MSNLGPIHAYRSEVEQFIPLLPGDCDLPDMLRRYKVEVSAKV